MEKQETITEESRERTGQKEEKAETEGGREGSRRETELRAGKSLVEGRGRGKQKKEKMKGRGRGRVKER